MLSELLERGRRGESLWLPEIREAFARDPRAERMIVRLRGRMYGVREYELFFPAARGREEQEFLLRALSANVYNLLSALSAEEVLLFVEENGNLMSLVRELPARFQSDPGLCKVSRIANRLYGGFRMRALSIAEYLPATEAGARFANESGGLFPLLRMRAQAADEMDCLGLDVGGSDIKVATSVHGRLLYTKEVNWNPMACLTADGILNPILSLVREADTYIREAGGTLTAVGISFPDVVIGDRIVGGETPKTLGMRKNPAIDYEAEFARLSGLREEVLALLPSGSSVRIANDGNMAAFTAALELAAAPRESSGEEEPRLGVLAHSLGTDLGSGWLLPNGQLVPVPLELYDLLLDLGDFPSLALDPLDLRSTRNVNSGMAGLRRYLGQAAAYRLAWKLDPSLLDGFTEEIEGILSIPTKPQDLRKPCLEHLMQAAGGNGKAAEIFRRIGGHLAVASREMEWIFGTLPRERYLFGRFVKSRHCFSLLQEGFTAKNAGFTRDESIQEPPVRLIAADDSLANTSLMRQLADVEGSRFAQFAQAVGAVCYAL